MRFQLLACCFACAILVASTQATRIEFKKCKIEVKDTSSVKLHKPCKPNGDTLSYSFELLKEISDDEKMNVMIKLDGETTHETEEKLVAAFETKKPYVDYNEDCGLNLFNPVSTGIRETDSCKVNGNTFQGMEDKQFEVYFTSSLMDITMNGQILPN